MSRVPLEVSVTPDHPVDADLLTTSPSAWLPVPVRPAGPDRFRTQVHAGPLSHWVEVTVGAPWVDSNGVWRPLRWHPVEPDVQSGHPSRVLPSLEAELGIVTGIDGAEPTHLTLTGSYAVPGGPAGLLVDRLALHHLAEATATDLLDRVAQRLSPSA